MLLAFDDTDDAAGGCTTSVVLDVLRAVPELALRGMPRLVRLNPNVPYKTRGNGAVCIELVVPQGPRVQVGRMGGQAIHAYPDGRSAPDAAWPKVRDAVLAAARPGADPGIVAWREAPPALAYWEAVRGRVEPPDVAPLLDQALAHAGGRGCVGAVAAAAWPGPAASYELAAYREPGRVGTPRRMEADVAALDAAAVTFHSYDLETGVVACVPHTDCPVLCGLRGHDPERLLEAALPVLEAAGEPVHAWLLWATNQASGDHVSPVEHIGQAGAWSTVQVTATIDRQAVTRRGGHAEIALHDLRGHAFLAHAFEPTKSLRGVLRALRPGDVVEVVGAWDGGIRLEKLHLMRLAPAQIKLENPVCPRCGRRMKSRGRDAGYRCPDGHGSAPEDAARRTAEVRTIRAGWYEVPVIARRHLHRPERPRIPSDEIP